MLNGAWLSLVERCVRDAEVAGSNPVAPTIQGFQCMGVRILGRGSLRGFQMKTSGVLFYLPLKEYYGFLLLFYKIFYKNINETQDA